MLIALTSSDEINMLACQIALTLFKTPTRIPRRSSTASLSRSPRHFMAFASGPEEYPGEPASEAARSERRCASD